MKMKVSLSSNRTKRHKTDPKVSFEDQGKAQATKKFFQMLIPTGLTASISYIFNLIHCKPYFLVA